MLSLTSLGITAGQWSRLLADGVRGQGCDLLDTSNRVVGDLTGVMVKGGQVTHDNNAGPGQVAGKCQVKLQQQLAWGRDRIRPWVSLTREVAQTAVRTVIDRPARSVSQVTDDAAGWAGGAAANVVGSSGSLVLAGPAVASVSQTTDTAAEWAAGAGASVDGSSGSLVLASQTQPGYPSSVKAYNPLVYLRFAESAGAGVAVAEAGANGAYAAGSQPGVSSSPVPGAVCPGNGYVTIPRFVIPTQTTFNCWFRAGANDLDDATTYRSLWGFSGNNWDARFDSRHHVHFHTYDAAGNWPPNSDLDTGTTLMNDGAWHMLTLVWDGVNGFNQTYLDGVPNTRMMFTPTTPRDESAYVSDFTIGGSGHARVWIGDFAEFSVMSVALTDAQVAALHNGVAEATVGYVGSGTWTSPALDASGIESVKSSLVDWSASVPAGTTLAVESSVDDGATWQTASDGGAVPNLPANPTGNVRLRATLTSTGTATPKVDSLAASVTNYPYRPSGTWTSPALDLASLQAVSSSLADWQATTPAGTTVAVATSTDDGATWQAATDGGPIPNAAPGGTAKARLTLTSDGNATPSVSSLTLSATQTEQSHTEVTTELVPQTVRINQGVFVLTTPQVPSGSSPATWDVLGYDLTSILGDLVGDTYVVPAGTTYLSALRAVVAASGIGTGLLLDGTAQDTTLPYTMVWCLYDGGPSWQAICNDLLSAIAYVPIWADENGMLRSGPDVPVADAPVAQAFTTDVTNTLVAASPAWTRDEDLWSAPNSWQFIRTNMATTPTEGDGIYTPAVNQSSGPSSVDSIGRTRRKVVWLDAADQAALVAQGDKIVAADVAAGQTVTFATWLPLASHGDVVTFAGGGRTDKLPVASWTTNLDGSPGQWVLGGTPPAAPVPVSATAVGTVTQASGSGLRVVVDGATVDSPANSLDGATYGVGDRVQMTARNPVQPLVQGVETTS